MINNDFCILIHYRNPFIVDAGTEKYIKTQIQTFEEKDIDSFVLFPVTKKAGVRIYGWGVALNRNFAGVWSEKKVIRYINSLMEKYSCQGVFVHHLQWSNLSSLSRIFSFTEDMIFYIHDYYSCCMQGNFLKNDECLCGKKVDSRNCEGCCYYTLSKKELEKIKKFLNGFRNLKIIAPSEVAKSVWSLTYPEYKERIVVIEHLKIEKVKNNLVGKKNTKDKVINVAFVGRGAHNKGWDEWKKAVTSLNKEVLSKYKFYHFGSTNERLENVEQFNVSMSQDGGTTMIKMLQKYDVDIAVLYSIWPETYSYTFFEVLEAGCYVITSRESGNIAEQIKEYQNGIIVNNDTESFADILKDYNRLSDALNSYNAKKKFTYVTKHNEAYFSFLKGTSNLITIKAKPTFGCAIADILYKLRYRKELN